MAVTVQSVRFDLNRLNNLSAHDVVILTSDRPNPNLLDRSDAEWAAIASRTFWSGR